LRPRAADAVSEAVRAQMNSQVVVRPVRAEALAAAAGTTDFGEYFLYFSAFLVASALLIAYLFFALSVEQRAREAGLLAAVGIHAAAGATGVLARRRGITAVGVLAGLAGAVAYAALIMHGLRTWWVDAVGTTALTLHLDPLALAAGALGAAAAALLALWLGTRSLSRRSPRALLHGATPQPTPRDARTARRGGAACAAVAAGLVAATQAGVVGSTGGFSAPAACCSFRGCSCPVRGSSSKADRMWQPDVRWPRSGRSVRAIRPGARPGPC
jgi:hypothetical protein